MPAVTIIIPGRVGGKGRPRVAVRGGFARVYTPQATRSMEAIVRDFAAQAMRGLPLFEGPVRITTKIWMHHPESWSKKRKATTVWVTGKPDTDNIEKLHNDAFNGIVWKDDAQVSESHLSRRYVVGLPEQVSITVEGLDGQDMGPGS